MSESDKQFIRSKVNFLIVVNCVVVESYKWALFFIVCNLIELWISKTPQPPTKEGGG